jgi:hypothetical protein
MAPFKIIYLLLSSVFILSSCAYNQYKRKETKTKEIITEKNLVPVIPSDGKAVKYKASIDVLNRHFSGIIVLKETEPGIRHLVFVTELGMRMFDFVMKGDSIHPEFVFEPLNKPKLIMGLTNGFRDMLLVGVYQKEASVKSGKQGEFYFVNSGKNNLVIIKDAANFTTANRVFAGKKKSSRSIYGANYESIDFKTYGLVKLKIKLDKIPDR